MKKAAHITSKGQITVPHEILRAPFSLEPDDITRPGSTIVV
jgi:hypothetical protein